MLLTDTHNSTQSTRPQDDILGLFIVFGNDVFGFVELGLCGVGRGLRVREAGKGRTGREGGVMWEG